VIEPNSTSSANMGFNCPFSPNSYYVEIGIFDENNKQLCDKIKHEFCVIPGAPAEDEGTEKLKQLVTLLELLKNQ